MSTALSIGSVGGAAVAAMAWRFRGHLHVTLIAKASFAFGPDGKVTRVAAQPIITAEVHHQNHPARSARFTTDLVPALARAEVLFTGHAHAPAGQTAKSLPV